MVYSRERRTHICWLSSWAKQRTKAVVWSLTSASVAAAAAAATAPAAAATTLQQWSAQRVPRSSSVRSVG